jgi:hypothetical protein
VTARPEMSIRALQPRRETEPALDSLALAGTKPDAFGLTYCARVGGPNRRPTRNLVGLVPSA